ncbi:MAG: bifunctional riboflavin kinase/FMN adenylyltransferase, partial [Terriglobia bacterium]
DVDHTGVLSNAGEHPAKVLAPDRAPRLITTVSQKLRRFEEEGIEAVLLLPFSLEFATLSPDDFVVQIVARTLAAQYVLVGEDFRFGHKQSGSVATLRQLGEEMGFEVEPISEIAAHGQRVSSSAIRKLVTEGRVSRACRMMAAPFALEGAVVAGKGIGSKQTVPTLNLAPENELLPKTGVYVTRTQAEGRAWRSITNVGYRPTFDGEGITVESFLLDSFDGETPERIEVEFLARMRDERKFDTPELLKAQIMLDVRAALGFHRRFERLRMA